MGPHRREQFRKLSGEAASAYSLWPQRTDTLKKLAIFLEGGRQSGADKPGLAAGPCGCAVGVELLQEGGRSGLAPPAVRGTEAKERKEGFELSS